jgi:hypothetical protein
MQNYSNTREGTVLVDNYTKIKSAYFTSSSLISRADYDPLLESLKVYFKGGEVYEYCGVPESVLKGIQEAESAGKFFSTNIKDKYEYIKML